MNSCEIRARSCNRVAAETLLSRVPRFQNAFRCPPSQLNDGRAYEPFSLPCDDPQQKKCNIWSLEGATEGMMEL